MDNWHNRFLEMAKHISTWSKDQTKVGSVIVEPETKNIVGLGYNGFPRGVKDLESRYNERETKYKLVCHAEQNAIWNSNKSVRGCDIYVYPTMMHPASCPDCAKAIVQSGIKRLFYYKEGDIKEHWKEPAEFSNIILREGGVECIAIERNEND